ncbi:hypothetical protein PS854_01313 [Pseudomonas fluorescens]|uniref:Uncharacterized protein n=1 Tax=Pseudomonas fluorescens TaxID=294 RepID=A0A5E7IA76_PSEFL|nr:hypothetical protein PS854_01313 [Pseudomonas fluorescens]
MGEGWASIGKGSRLRYHIPCGEGACARRVAKRPPAFFLEYLVSRYYDGFAAEREQAPSPQTTVMHGGH